MSQTTLTLLEAVLKLSDKERTEIAMRVLESLPPEMDLALDDDDLEEKLNARKIDDEGSISWAELKAKL